MKIFRILLFSLTIFAMGCATYADRVKSANANAQQAKTEEALAQFNEALGVKSIDELPKDLKGNQTLLLLERATLLQSIGRHDLAARDMVLVDQHMAWLDVNKSTKDALAKYLYSGKKSIYRSPPVERMMLNILNLTNFLALRNFSGAKVEARRFQILESFFVTDQEESISPQVIALGNYLGGVAFEGAGDFPNAARSYGRAYHYGIRDKDIETRLIDLMRVSARSEKEFDTSLSGLDGLAIRAKDLGSLSTEAYREKHLIGDVIVFVQSGMAPMKKAESIPIEKAESLSGVTGTKGINAVNFPTVDGERLGRIDATLVINGSEEKLKSTAHLSKELERAHLAMTPILMTAAVSRAAARSLAGTGAQSGTVALASHNPTGKALGWLAGTAVKGTLNANDQPDTRSWTTLPAHLIVKRLKMDTGSHPIEVKNHGRTETKMIDVTKAPSPTFVNFSRNR